MTEFIVLGAGLTGLSCAYHLKREYKIIEKLSNPGGLCRSDYVKNFTFDYAGHYMHLKNDYTKKLIKKLLGNNLQTIKRNSAIYSNDIFTPYPYQCNLYGLPTEIINECLLTYIKSMYEKKSMKVNNFYDWIIKYLGEGIGKYFMIPYNEKLWTVHPRQMSINWLKNFVPNPNLEEIILGAISKSNKEWGYNIEFYYPKYGGIFSLILKFLEHIDHNLVYYNKQIRKINIFHKCVVYEDGSKDNYDNLISTIPLNKLIRLLDINKTFLNNASLNLKYNVVLNVNYALKNKATYQYHWIYIPERKYPFYRIGIPSNISAYNVPNNKSSLSVEWAFPSNMRLSNDFLNKCIMQITKGLIDMNLIKKNNDILFIHHQILKPAYVIYNYNWYGTTHKLLNYLKNNNIYSIGRYGSWEYSDMEKAILDGKNIVQYGGLYE